MFRARSNEGHSFKVLTELLMHNLKTCSYKITEDGMTMSVMDNMKRVFFDIQLNGEKFDLYKYKYKDTKTIGLNLSHFYKMLKSIKKKDIVELFISNENSFGIMVTPKDNSRTTTSYLTIQNVQNIEITSPVIDCKPIIISSMEFQKMIKDMITIGSKTQIDATQNTLTFKCIADGVYSREVQFGNKDDDDSTDVIYSDVFNTEYLAKIVKIAGLSNKIYVYPTEDNPILLKSNIGSLGEISIYLKSIKLLQAYHN